MNMYRQWRQEWFDADGNVLCWMEARGDSPPLRGDEPAPLDTDTDTDADNNIKAA